MSEIRRVFSHLWPCRLKRFPIPFRSVLISFFVTGWLLAFHYESLRYFYLNPAFDRELPKIKFLFPPAGWIMFYRVDNQFSCAVVYGVKNGRKEFIDPHDILPTRFIGFDNVKRNVLLTALEGGRQESFCRYLTQRIKGFERFDVTAITYPSLTDQHHGPRARVKPRPEGILAGRPERIEQLRYECRP